MREAAIECQIAHLLIAPGNLLPSTYVLTTSPICSPFLLTKHTTQRYNCVEGHL